MTSKPLQPVSGEVLEEEVELTLAELCRVCGLPAEQLFELLEEGIVEPLDREATRFQGVSVRRVRCAVQLRRDLGVNWAGAALVLDLLEELQVLRARVGRFED